MESRFFSVLMYFTLRFGILKPFWIDAEQGGSECRAWRFISFCLMFSRLYTHTESTSRLLLLREPFTLTILYPALAFLAASSSLNRYSLQSRWGIHIHTYTLLNYLALYFFFSNYPCLGFFQQFHFFKTIRCFSVLELVAFWYWHRLERAKNFCSGIFSVFLHTFFRKVIDRKF